MLILTVLAAIVLDGHIGPLALAGVATLGASLRGMGGSEGGDPEDRNSEVQQGFGTHSSRLPSGMHSARRPVNGLRAQM